ncbi:MAG: NAD-dependent epimerase/dehydratase family protein [Candidatus Yanofskybacteria bacterium]|nr:NAD-dependent epimerase/dehydratase family protein [Candidatus Yanofskybacteria bacterium]
MQKKIVVTGGAGFIGSNLVNTLCRDGYAVVALDNLVSGRRDRLDDRVRFIKADVREPGALVGAFEGADAVFHLAALPRVQLSIADPVGTAAVNVFGTINALVAAQVARVRRFVFASSSSVYGNPPVLPTPETTELNPLSPYANHKKLGESSCGTWSDIYGLETVCLRFFNVYGPGFDPSGQYALVIGKFIMQRLAGTPLTIWGDGQQARDFTHVSDVVNACARAINAKLPGKANIINIGAGNPTKVAYLAELIGGPVVHEPARTGEPRNSFAAIRRAAELLDWKPLVSIETGIRMLKQDMGLCG